MKTLHRYKKVFKNTCLSIICALFFVVSFAPPAKAATNSGAGTVQSGSTTYGTYSWLYSKSGILGQTFGNESNWSTLSVDIDLNGYYSGNVTVTISGVSNFANIGIFVQGGYIGAQSSNQVRVQIVYTNHIHIEFYSTTPFVATSYNWSCSVGVGTLNRIDDSEASSLDNMDSTMNTISTAITSTTNGLPAIYNKLDSIEDAIDLIANSLNTHNINGLRVRLNFNSSGYTYQQFEYPAYSDNYFQSTINNLNVVRIGVAFNSVIMNGNYLLIQFYLRSSDSIPNSFADNLVFGSRDISSNVRTISNVYKVISRFGSNTLFLSIYVPLDSIYMYGNTNEYLYDFDISGINIPSMSLFGFSYLGVVNNLPYDDNYISLLQQIADGIGNISQQQIIENNTNINNYNNYQTSINNVENNYYQEFNTYENNIEQNNTFDFTGLSSDGITVYHNLFTSIFQIDLIKWPLLITLLGLIIVIILG